MYNRKGNLFRTLCAEKVSFFEAKQWKNNMVFEPNKKVIRLMSPLRKSVFGES